MVYNTGKHLHSGTVYHKKVGCHVRYKCAQVIWIMLYIPSSKSETRNIQEVNKRLQAIKRQKPQNTLVLKMLKISWTKTTTESIKSDYS